MLKITRGNDGALQAVRGGKIVVTYHKNNPALLAPLSEEASLHNIMEEMNQRSITPTTFDNFEIENVDSAFFREKYSYGTDEVTHFGINNIISSTEVYDAISFCGGLAKAGQTVLSPSSGKKTSFAAITLAPLEIDLLTRAIDHLFSSSTKVVLLDIFPRHKYDGDHGKIIGSNNIPDVHSVLLYKNGASEVFVIDPSNFRFSDHLAGNYNGIEVKTCRVDLKIYKAYTNDVGKKFTQNRDCTDIAVKLAFQLNKENIIFQMVSTDPRISNAKALEDSIKSCASIQRLSNNKDLDTNIFTDDTVVTRIKQSSDARIVKLFCKLEYLLRVHFNHIAVIEQLDSNKELIENILRTETSYNDTIIRLYQVNDGSVTLIDKDLEQEMVALGVIVESSCCMSCVIS